MNTSEDLVVRLAKTSRELEQVYRLRYQVFVEEAQAHGLANASGLETDRFDQWADHLVVIDPDMDSVVGTYRLLPGARPGASGVYTQTEFDLGTFTPLVSQALEIGRTCVHPDYRDTPAMSLLWNGMFRYLAAGRFRYLMGCASISGTCHRDVQTIYSYLRSRPNTIDKYGVTPLATHRTPYPLSDQPVDDPVAAHALLPTLIKGYLRINGEAAKDPVYDPLFDTFDFFMLLDTSVVSPRYYRRFWQPLEAAAR